MDEKTNKTTTNAARPSWLPPNLVLLGIGMLLAGVCAEFALRAFYGASMDASAVTIHRASDDPELIYELTPNAEATSHGVVVRVNADGFRDDPFPGPRRPGEARILIIGDSVTAGLGVAMPDAFAQVLERSLNERLLPGTTSATVFNMGIYGYATSQELRLLRKRGLALDPDLIVLAYHLNDPDLTDAGQTRHFTRQPLAILELLEHTRTRLTRGGDDREWHHRVHEDNAAEIARHFRELGELSRKSEIPVLVAVVPVFEWDGSYEWRSIHHRLEALSVENGLGFLDLAEPLTAYPQSEVTLDIWHPNPKGHNIIAASLEETIRSNPTLYPEPTHVVFSEN